MANRVGVVFPVLNGGSMWQKCIQAYRLQTMTPERSLLIDSTSDDDTVSHARHAGFEVHIIPRKEFNHGSTRQLGVEILKDVDLVVMLTHDAFLASPDSLAQIVKPFADPKVGAVCGRQLPHKDAFAIAAHARAFNYPPLSAIISAEDIARLGIKAAFMSDSFSAYRRTALEAIGGFPKDVIMAEDMFVAARMLLAGWKIAYAGKATVFHSHNYTLAEDFRRYFDVGVFHSQQPWIRANFGGVRGEGGRFVRSELSYLSKNSPASIPSALLRSLLKVTAYRLGTQEAHIPMKLKTKLSLYRFYWQKKGLS